MRIEVRKQQPRQPHDLDSIYRKSEMALEICRLYHCSHCWPTVPHSRCAPRVWNIAREQQFSIASQPQSNLMKIRKATEYIQAPPTCTLRRDLASPSHGLQSISAAIIGPSPLKDTAERYFAPIKLPDHAFGLAYTATEALSPQRLACKRQDVNIRGGDRDIQAMA
jgi:hypothetical protein